MQTVAVAVSDRLRKIATPVRATTQLTSFYGITLPFARLIALMENLKMLPAINAFFAVQNASHVLEQQKIVPPVDFLNMDLTSFYISINA